MKQSLSKPDLIALARAVRNGYRIDAGLVRPFLAHAFPETSATSKFMLRVAALISLFFASVLVIFPEVGEFLIKVLPGFFLLPERLATGLDYIWGLVGKPVGKQHLMYHIPNIIIYAFGVAGIRQLWRKIHKSNWKDLVEEAQKTLSKQIGEGTARFSFAPGFSVLFAGQGDQIAKSLIVDNPTIGATIASNQQNYTELWGKYDPSEGTEGFDRVMQQFNTEDAGEYVLFPVQDDQLFLPGKNEYDIAPHRVEIAVRRIREYEAANQWSSKRIIIIGDKEQKSRFSTASRSGQLDAEDDEISLRSIAENQKNVVILDPTDAILLKIIEIARGRQILFRASDQGVERYSRAFFRRLSMLGYEPTQSQSLTIGYDISDLETEHQVVAKHQSAYLPVILSRDVFDGLVKNHLRPDAYIFVPHLVKRELKKLVDEQ